MGVTACALVLCAMLALWGCKRKDSDTPDITGPAASASVRPIDQLAPGELVQGTEDAFGILLPRDVHVEQRFVDVVYARGNVEPHEVADYIQRRIRGGTVRREDGVTIFAGASVPKKPGLAVDVRIRTGIENSGARLEVRDTTPRPPPKQPTERERWRQAGLKPNGEPLEKHTIR